MTISSHLAPERMRVLHYLTTPGHPERRMMLQDLDAKHVWEQNLGGISFTAIIQTYILDNPRQFCQEGIARFLAEFPQFAPPKPKKAKLTVTLDIEIEDPPDRFGASERSDAGIVLDVERVLVNHLAAEMQNKSKHSPHKPAVTSVRWSSYNASEPT